MKGLAALLLLASTSLAADPITILSLNVESGGACPAINAGQLAELPTATVFVMQEVGDRQMGRYSNEVSDAHGSSYRFIESWTGQGDRVLFAFDESRLQLLETLACCRKPDPRVMKVSPSRRSRRPGHEREATEAALAGTDRA